jgi:hypothetical protein
MSALDRAFEHMREGARGLAGFGIDEIIDTGLSVLRHPVALDVKSVGFSLLGTRRVHRVFQAFTIWRMAAPALQKARARLPSGT